MEVTTPIIVAIITALGAIVVALLTRPKKTKATSGNILAKKIEQCTILTKFIPAWLITENKFDGIPSELTSEDIAIIQTELQPFIYSSVYDQWSAEFFKISYDQIPEVELQISLLREKLREFHQQLESSTKKDQATFKLLWKGLLKEELKEIRILVVRVRDSAERICNESIATLNSQS